MKHLSRILLSLALALCVFTAADAKVALADPFIFYDKATDTYYAYGTYAADGILVFTSKDLRTWHRQGLALNKRDTNVPRFFWAPEVYKIGNEYIMYFSGNEHLFVAKGKSPLGPFKQVDTKPMLAEKSIDSSLFYDKKGKPFITFVRMNDGNNIWAAPLEKDLCTIDSAKMRHCFSVSQPWEQVQARVVEGPCVFRRGGKYVMIYSANDYQSQRYGLGIATAKNPLGPWEKRADNPFLQCPDTLVGVGHNSFFTDKDGQLRIVFHAHDSRKSIHPRNMYIGTLEFPDKKDKTRAVVTNIIEAEEE